MKAYLCILFILLLSNSQAYSQINNALIVVPQTDNSGPTFLDNCYENALLDLDIPFLSYLEVSDFIPFIVALGNSEPSETLVIIDSWFINNFADWTSFLVNFVDQGGTVILSSWRLNMLSNLSDYGVASAVQDNSTSYAVYDWNGSDVFGSLGSPLSFDASQVNVQVSSNTPIMLTPMSMAMAYAGFTPNINETGQTAIVYNENLTTLGFCINLMENKNQCNQFASNLIQNSIFGEVFIIPSLEHWGIIILTLLLTITGVRWINHCTLEIFL